LQTQHRNSRRPRPLQQEGYYSESPRIPFVDTYAVARDRLGGCAANTRQPRFCNRVGTVASGSARGNGEPGASGTRILATADRGAPPPGCGFARTTRWDSTDTA